MQVPGDTSLSEKKMGDMNQPAKCVYQDQEGDLKSQKLRSLPWIFVNNIFLLMRLIVSIVPLCPIISLAVVPDIKERRLNALQWLQ